MTISCFALIVFGCLTCNSCAIAFINTKNRSKGSLKDKIVTLLCVINILQVVGYLIELQATIKTEITNEQCQVSGFMISMLTYTSIGYFVALTVERYFAIKLPYKYETWFSDGRNAWWLGAPLLFGILLAVPPLVGWGKYSKDHVVDSLCTLSLDAKYNAKSYFIVASIFAFVVPLTVTGVCFTHILCALHEVASDMKRRYGHESPLWHHGKRSFKEQWLSCLMTGVVYVGSWVPYASVCCCLFFGISVNETTEIISLFFCKTSTISSPIIYCFVEKRFRSYVVKLTPQLQRRLSRGGRKHGVASMTQQTYQLKPIRGSKKISLVGVTPQFQRGPHKVSVVTL